MLEIACVAPDRLEAALDDSLCRELTRTSLVHLTLQGAGWGEHTGARLLADLLAAYDEGRAPTHSELEDLFLEVVRRHGLPEPVRQYPLLDPPVDFAFLPAPVAAETDGWRFHRSKAKRAKDRHRERQARALGWSLIRVSWDDLHERPDEVAMDIAAQLERAA
ncbi:MAG TPA: DUF559 domain-containing protein [Acidimicrobiia bacterium]|nr:DUF559 domain-containing protein [Acidimicrobiia bacterium]